MYRLIENVYEADKDGALRLTERIPVNGEVRSRTGATQTAPTCSPATTPSSP